MRTFFIAFLLGVFVGALATGYFSKPGAYEGLLPESWTREQQEPEPEPDPRPAEPPPRPAAEQNAKAAQPEPADRPDAEDSLGETAEKTYEQAKEKASQFAEAAAEKTGEWAEKAKTAGQAALEASQEASVSVKIQAKFKLDDELRGAAIEVSVDRGRVTLSGQVPSREIEQKAIATAIETRGVKEVVSRLEIAESPAP